MTRKRIVLAGGSGFIGSALAHECLSKYGEVVVLTRTPRKRDDGVTEAQWSGEHIGEWIKYLNGADAVVNLAGKNINCRHTGENVPALTESRVNSVCAIGQALEHIKYPPHVWIQASAIGYYGDAKDKICDETSPNGSDTLSDICRQWEYAFNHVPAPGTRKVLLRIGIVLGRNGGALPVLARLTKFFLGGSAGSGEQFMSWIQIKDLMRIVEESITRREWSGTFNAVAPNPVRNAEFMRELRRTLHRPWGLSAPTPAIKIGARLMKTEPSLALDSCRAVPKRLSDAGFQFQFPKLSEALKAIYE